MAAARQSSKKKEKLPFYQTTGDKTSASIIAEARKDLKSVSTKRPNTPGDAGRHLFGSHQHSTQQQGTVKRPPSVYRWVVVSHCWKELLLLCIAASHLWQPRAKTSVSRPTPSPTYVRVYVCTYLDQMTTIYG